MNGCTGENLLSTKLRRRSPPEGHISIMPRTKVIDAATIHSNLRRHPEDEEQAAEKWKGLRNEEEKREVFLS